MRTDFNASGRYFSMSVSLKKHGCTFMYLFSPCTFLSLVATRACIPKTHPQDKTAESLLITLTITQQLRRDLGPFPHCLSPSLMRKSSPASAGSLLPRLRQDTARQYIFIKAQAWSCSRELRFNVIYGESLPREIMEPPVYLAWSGRLGICQWARRGCCMNRNRNQPAHPPCSIYPSSEAPSCGISYRFSAPLTLLFNLYVILSYCLSNTCMWGGVTPSWEWEPSPCPPVPSHPVPQMPQCNRWEGVWWHGAAIPTNWKAALIISVVSINSTNIYWIFTIC